jgi:hypothetical protein
MADNDGEQRYSDDEHEWREEKDRPKKRKRREALAVMVPKFFIAAGGGAKPFGLLSYGDFPCEGCLQPVAANQGLSTCCDCLGQMGDACCMAPNMYSCAHCLETRYED